MKRLGLSLVLVCCSVSLTGLGAAPSKKPFTRNKQAAAARPGIAKAATAGGLAPTTWGFVSAYSGSLYGTGYYPFRVDATYSGANSIYGYTFNYPASGFQNEIRAVYAFDLASIVGRPGPIWSSFMFDVRERPASGSSGLAAFANMQLNVGPGSTRLTGLSLFQGGYATNLDVFDAEDFENAAPFDNPDLAFTGNNPQLGTIPVTSETVIPIDFDVTSAVSADLGLFESVVPAAGKWGLAGFAGLLLAAGLFLVRRNGLV